jgi:hypothetical protein
MFNFHKPRFIYTQKDIADHLGVIADLNKQRDKLMQQITLARSDVKQSKYVDTLNLVDDNIHTAQLSLKHMLSKNLKRVQDL